MALRKSYSKWHRRTIREEATTSYSLGMEGSTTMRRLLASIALIAFSGPLHAQAPAGAPVEIKGHFIGESIGDFLSMEPEAQQEVDVCREHKTRSSCGHLLGALDRGERTEISTSAGMDFVLDAGRLVKLTVLVRESTDGTTEALTRKFGIPAAETNMANHNSTGANWQNRLFVWNTASAYATLYEDNNPSLQDHQPLLVVESQSEHILDDAEAAKHTQAVASNLPQ